MSIIVNKVSEKKFEVPEDGLYKAVVADVVDIGEVETKFGKKHRVRFVYMLEDTDTEGRQFRLFQQMNVSLHEKSQMFKLIRRLTGTNPGLTFDLEDLLGKQCQLDVQQSESDGKVYANVVSVLANQKGQNVKVASDFVRAINKDKQSSPQSNPNQSSAKPAVPAANTNGVSVTPQSETVTL